MSKHTNRWTRLSKSPVTYGPACCLACGPASCHLPVSVSVLHNDFFFWCWTTAIWIDRLYTRSEISYYVRSYPCVSETDIVWRREVYQQHLLFDFYFYCLFEESCSPDLFPPPPHWLCGGLPRKNPLFAKEDDDERPALPREKVLS